MRRSPVPRLPILLLSPLLAVVLIAGCGSTSNGIASKSPTEILATSRTTAEHASSVRISHSSSQGKAVTTTLDAVLTKDDGEAQFSLLGVSFDVIHIGDTTYFKGNRRFAARLSQALSVRIPPNVWVKDSSGKIAAEIGEFTHLGYDTHLLLAGGYQPTKGSTTNIAGQPAIELKEARKLSNATIYIATTGRPYPLLMRRAGQETAETTFTDWNKPVTFDSPTDAIELSQLQHHA